VVALLQVFSAKTFYVSLIILMDTACPSHITFFDFITLILNEKYNVCLSRLDFQ
jgi:hypothetical protein